MTALEMIERWNKRDRQLASRGRHNWFPTMSRDEIAATIAWRRMEAEKELGGQERVRALAHLANWEAPTPWD